MSMRLKHWWKHGTHAMCICYDQMGEPYLVMRKSYINRKKRIKRL